MISVSQCHSSTSFVPSEVTPYYSFINGTMQKTKYTALPQPIHYNNGEKTKSFLESQILQYDELHAKPTLSVFPTTRQKTVSSPVSNDSIQTLDRHHRYLNDSQLHATEMKNNYGVCPAPLDLTCHKLKEYSFDKPAPPEIVMECSRLGNDSYSNRASSMEVDTDRITSDDYSAKTINVDSHFDEEMIRRQKRREQNKAAAQSYRLRKKSVTELIETEHEVALKRNKQLMTYKTTLEAEISRMRSLLQEIAMTSKLKNEEKLLPLGNPVTVSVAKSNRDPNGIQSKALDFSRPSVTMACSNLCSTKRNQRLVSLDISSASSSSFDTQSSSSPPESPDTQQLAFTGPWTNPMDRKSIPQISIKEEELPAMRPRQNTWPMDATTSHIHNLTGKNRKKEQNRLASRRFRVRRKMEMSDNEIQLNILEKRNHKLRRICDDYSKKIEVIKEVLEKLGCSIPVK